MKNIEWAYFATIAIIEPQIFDSSKDQQAMSLITWPVSYSHQLRIPIYTRPFTLGQTRCNDLKEQVSFFLPTMMQLQYLLFLCFACVLSSSTSTKGVTCSAKLMPSSCKPPSGPGSVLSILTGGSTSSGSKESIGLFRLYCALICEVIPEWLLDIVRCGSLNRKRLWHKCFPSSVGCSKDEVVFQKWNPCMYILTTDN